MPVVIAWETKNKKFVMNRDRQKQFSRTEEEGLIWKKLPQVPKLSHHFQRLVINLLHFSFNFESKAVKDSNSTPRETELSETAIFVFRESCTEN